MLGQGTAEVKGKDKPYMTRRSPRLPSMGNRTLGSFFWFDGTRHATLRWRGGGTLGLSEARRRGSSRPPPAHSSTWSARARKDRRIVRPRALAVFRLITSSNIVGFSIGSSPALAPLRILSMYRAACRQPSVKFGLYDMRPPATPVFPAHEHSGDSRGELPALQLGVEWARGVAGVSHRQSGQGKQSEEGRAEERGEHPEEARPPLLDGDERDQPERRENVDGRAHEGQSGRHVLGHGLSPLGHHAPSRRTVVHNGKWRSRSGHVDGACYGCRW